MVTYFPVVMMRQNWPRRKKRSSAAEARAKGMKMVITVDEMRRHVFALWGGEDEIEWCDRPSQAYAIREAGVIRIAPIKSEVSYATALHEIGHIYGRHQRSRSVMVRERWAWRWAAPERPDLDASNGAAHGRRGGRAQAHGRPVTVSHARSFLWALLMPGFIGFLTH
jgi:hypothetical protein